MFFPSLELLVSALKTSPIGYAPIKQELMDLKSAAESSPLYGPYVVAFSSYSSFTGQRAVAIGSNVSLCLEECSCRS
jgi:hypothetical protein